MVNIGSRREVSALSEGFVCRTPEEFQCFDTKASHAGSHFLLAQVLCLELGVLEAVEQEVHQIRDNSFGTFRLQ